MLIKEQGYPEFSGLFWKHDPPEKRFEQESDGYPYF
jgi:hypothetical protein